MIDISIVDRGDKATYDWGTQLVVDWNHPKKLDDNYIVEYIMTL
jgi:hypothetical protein